MAEKPEVVKSDIVKYIPNGATDVVETVSTLLYGSFMLLMSAKALWPQLKQTLSQGKVTDHNDAG